MSSGIFPDARPLEYELIGGLNFSFAVLLAPLATSLTPKFGMHAVMLSGSLLQGVGYVAASFASSTWHLYLSQGLLVGCGIGFMIIPSTAILSQWFSKKRSIVNGVSCAGSGVGGAAFAWGTAAMIRRLGLGWALRITGLITVTANVMATLLIRDRNHHINPTQLALDFKLLQQEAVTLLLLWAFVSMFGYIVLLFSLSDFALEIGLSPNHATDIVGFSNLGTAVGRPVVGIISDRVSRVKTAGVLTFLCGAICFAFWIPATSFGRTIFFSLVCGAILGFFWMVCYSTLLAVVKHKALASNSRTSDYRSFVCRSCRSQKPPTFTISLLGHNCCPHRV